MNNIKEELAKDLLEIKAVTLSPNEPFIWASGIKSPIYCDNRLTISYPNIREKISNTMSEIIKEKYKNVDMISGAATGGIPHASLISNNLKLPMTYVRASSKGHGKENKIEGVYSSGQKAIVIEDLISTGGSSLAVVDALRHCEVEVIGLLAIFTYNFKKAEEDFKAKKVNYETLTDYNTLIEIAREINYINEDELKILKEWRDNK